MLFLYIYFYNSEIRNITHLSRAEAKLTQVYGTVVHLILITSCLIDCNHNYVKSGENRMNHLSEEDNYYLILRCY